MTVQHETLPFSNLQEGTPLCHTGPKLSLEPLPHYPPMAHMSTVPRYPFEIQTHHLSGIYPGLGKKTLSVGLGAA